MFTKPRRKDSDHHLHDFDEADLPHYKIPLALAVAIWIFNVALLIAGGVVAGVVDYRWTDDSAAVWSHDDEGSVQSRARLAFFYVTIPFVLSVLSSVELERLNRKEMPSVWIPMSSVCAFVLWAVQVGWQARCIWVRSENRGACPWAFAGGIVPRSTWGSGLTAAWVVPWLILPLLVLYAFYFFFGVNALRGSRPCRAPTIPLMEQDRAEDHPSRYSNELRSSSPGGQRSCAALA
ncbi:hypothetical protein DOTSEDRAFT_56613 [Dothistroma septosporum NZE10]|uniref:Uncharacterized protein n=1 Tax=Dothistroma septosporum (strain NZE10 / CBS 128990) TaxID=675120 RepID=M2WJH8_DOTSN|nr:hypothetical protein DOTSEDRAFT_56613 [Dothistroma septosporum NZE10]